jgi:tryptophan-rich sensory protein
MRRDTNDRLYSWRYVHLALFVTGVTTFGFLDAFTAVLMMEKYGIGAEFNPLMRGLFLTQGIAGFLAFKVLAAALILSVPFLLYKRERMNWTTAGFLSVFAVSGAVAAIDNYIFLMSGQVGIGSEIVVVLFLVMMVVTLQMGEIMDLPQKKMFKISDEKWERMKLEMGYPRV